MDDLILDDKSLPDLLDEKCIKKPRRFNPFATKRTDLPRFKEIYSEPKAKVPVEEKKKKQKKKPKEEKKEEEEEEKKSKENTKFRKEEAFKKNRKLEQEEGARKKKHVLSNETIRKNTMKKESA